MMEGVDVLYLTHAPGPPLNVFVDRFWLVMSGQASRKERILPSGTIELVVNLHEDEVRILDAAEPEQCRRLSGAAVSGTYSNVFVCDARQHESMLGVHFRPGGAHPFLGVKANELAGTHCDLADLWRRPALELRERLCAAPTPQAQFQIIEENLRERLLHKRSELHPATAMALEMFGPSGTGASVRAVAREAGLSQRRFIELFATQVGLTPKLFCRLLRFQKARTLLELAESGHATRIPDTRTARTVNWARLALTCGYFDQSHFIHDFEEFSGLSPTEYVRQNHQDGRLLQNHVPIPG